MTLVNKIIDFRYAILYYTTCTVYCEFTTPSQVSFHQLYASFTLFYLPQPLFPLVITILLSVSLSRSCFLLCLIPLTSFTKTTDSFSPKLFLTKAYLSFALPKYPTLSSAKITPEFSISYLHARRLASHLG